MTMRAPILFIHGTAGKPAHFAAWALHFEGLGHRCLVPALPGHDPDDPAALDRLTFADFTKAMEEALKALGEPAVVIGYSIGGVIGQVLAASMPVAGLVLVASPPARPYLPGSALAASGLPYAWRVLRGRAFRPSERTLRALLVHDLAPAEQDETVGDFGHEAGRAIRALALGEVRVAAAQIACPVMLVHGARDRVVPLVTATGLARRLKAEFLLVPGRGHWLLAESLAGTIVPHVADWIGRGGAAKPVSSHRPGAEL